MPTKQRWFDTLMLIKAITSIPPYRLQEDVRRREDRLAYTKEQYTSTDRKYESDHSVSIRCASCLSCIILGGLPTYAMIGRAEFFTGDILDQPNAAEPYSEEPRTPIIVNKMSLMLRYLTF